MKYYSTHGKTEPVSARTAVLSGLAQDGGLFMPVAIPSVFNTFSDDLSSYSFHEIGLEVARGFLADEVDSSSLREIVEGALTFDAPLVSLTDTTFVLELFHGPTLSFKDFGARFMARLMSYFRRGEDRDLTILVATSGDTGSAVASGFFKVKGIKVILLYPSGKVSHLQEQQLTTLGENITAVEIQGSFDDCQRLTKQAFVDRDLTARLALSSANSINIGRLIPQSFYYFHTATNICRLLGRKHPPLVFSVPSGNFGNLTGGLLAKHMGLPVKRFIAATNANDVFVSYLQTGIFTPRASQKTISNAMDVGNPSNFSRLLELYEHQHEELKRDISGASFSDQETRAAIAEVNERFDYAIDPHGAVGYLGLSTYPFEEADRCGIALETAHPAKFIEVMDEVIPGKVKMPERLASVLDKEKRATVLSSDFEEFKAFLLGDI